MATVVTFNNHRNLPAGAVHTPYEYLTETERAAMTAADVSVNDLYRKYLVYDAVEGTYSEYIIIATSPTLIWLQMAIGASAHAAVTLNAAADAVLELNGQELQLDSQTARYALIAPVGGGVPVFRAVVAADVSDFDAEVSNNADVAANTSARHTRSHDLHSTSDHANVNITPAAGEDGKVVYYNHTSGKFELKSVTSASDLETAATIYVDATNGNDGNNGKRNAPKATISAGVSAASSGDRLVVQAGTYTENVTINNKRLAVGGTIAADSAGRPSPIITGKLTLSGGATDVFTAQNVTLQASGADVALIVQSGAPHAFYNCYIDDDTGAAVTLDGTAANPTVHFWNCYIYGDVNETGDTNTVYLHGGRVEGDITVDALYCENLPVVTGTITATIYGMYLDNTGKAHLGAGTGINEFSIDGALAGNSDDAVPTEKAVKTYVDALTDEKVKATAGDAAGYLDAKVDNDTIEVSTNALRVKVDGIDGTHLDLGVTGNQVNAGIIPITDSSGHFATDDVESALASLFPNIGVAYVSATAAGAAVANGSILRPYQTLTAAKTALGTSGVIIILDNSTYTENLTIADGSSFRIVGLSGMPVMPMLVNGTEGLTPAISGFTDVVGTLQVENLLLVNTDNTNPACRVSYGVTTGILRARHCRFRAANSGALGSQEALKLYNLSTTQLYGCTIESAGTYAIEADSTGNKLYTSYCRIAGGVHEANIATWERYSTIVDEATIQADNSVAFHYRDIYWQLNPATPSRTDDDTLTVTDNTASQNFWIPGRIIGFEISGTWYYAMVESYASGTIEIEGAAFTTAVDVYGLITGSREIVHNISGASDGDISTHPVLATEDMRVIAVYAYASTLPISSDAKIKLWRTTTPNDSSPSANIHNDSAGFSISTADGESDWDGNINTTYYDLTGGTHYCVIEADDVNSADGVSVMVKCLPKTLRVLLEA